MVAGLLRWIVRGICENALAGCRHVVNCALRVLIFRRSRLKSLLATCGLALLAGYLIVPPILGCIQCRGEPGFRQEDLIGCWQRGGASGSVYCFWKDGTGSFCSGDQYRLGLAPRHRIHWRSFGSAYIQIDITHIDSSFTKAYCASITSGQLALRELDENGDVGRFHRRPGR